MRLVFCLLIPISAIGCYTALSPLDAVEDEEIQTLRVEHHLVDPWWAYRPGYGYQPYGYGYLGALYLYDPYYSYYYGDPWWYIPRYDDEGDDPRGPAVGTVGDAPAPAPRAIGQSAPPPATEPSPPPPQRTKRRVRKADDEKAESGDRSTVGDSRTPRRETRKAGRDRPDAR